MKEFVLLFRMDITSKEAQPTEEQMKTYMQQWTEWIDTIANKSQLVEGGRHFSRKGRILLPGNQVIEKPYTAEDISVAGYIIILARNMEDATVIAGKCPILNGQNTSVEIRETATPGS